MIKSESSAEKLPGAAPVLDLIEAFRRSKTMFAAVELGVFDRLGKSPDDAATLAARLGLNRPPLQRLPDACVALGFLHQQRGLYSNLPPAHAHLLR